MVVLVPHGEVPKTLPVLRLATQKPILFVDAFFGVELLATTFAGKDMATVLPNSVRLGICKDLKALSQTLQGELSHSLVLCPFTLIPSSNNMISLTNLPLKPVGPSTSI